MMTPEESRIASDLSAVASDAVRAVVAALGADRAVHPIDTAPHPDHTWWCSEFKDGDEAHARGAVQALLDKVQEQRMGIFAVLPSPDPFGMEAVEAVAYAQADGVRVQAIRYPPRKSDGQRWSSLRIMGRPVPAEV
jgi:hypothetical protein